MMDKWLAFFKYKEVIKIRRKILNPSKNKGTNRQFTDKRDISG